MFFAQIYFHEYPIVFFRLEVFDFTISTVEKGSNVNVLLSHWSTGTL